MIYTHIELEVKLGEAIKTLRLNMNLDRQALCNKAQISMNALRHLEDGIGANIKTLIKVAIILGKTDWILGLAPQISINPLYLVRSGKVRRRAPKNRAAGKQAPFRNQTNGMVYFIKGSSGAIKIGFSYNPLRRLKDLQSANGEKLTLIKSYPGTKFKEKELHSKFNHIRLFGEWFYPQKDLIEFIEKDAEDYFKVL